MFNFNTKKTALRIRKLTFGTDPTFCKSSFDQFSSLEKYSKQKAATIMFTWGNPFYLNNNVNYNNKECKKLNTLVLTNLEIRKY